MSVSEEATVGSRNFAGAAKAPDRAKAAKAPAPTKAASLQRTIAEIEATPAWVKRHAEVWLLAWHGWQEDPTEAELAWLRTFISDPEVE